MYDLLYIMEYYFKHSIKLIKLVDGRISLFLSYEIWSQAI